MKGKEYISIMQNDESPLLESNALITLAKKYFYNDEKRKNMQSAVFQYIGKHAAEYKSVSLNSLAVETKVKVLYQPSHKGDLNYYITQIPNEILNPFFVSVEEQCSPPKGYISERDQKNEDYFKAMREALDFVVSTAAEPLTNDYIKQVHIKAACQCKPLVGLRGLFSEGGFYDIPVEPGQYHQSKGVEVKDNCVTPLGLLEINTDFESFDGSKYCPLFLTTRTPLMGCGSSVNEILKDYASELGNPLPLAQLKAIVKMCRSLERLHPFLDGNTRTFGLILNRELVNHGFKPAILDNPRRFDGHTLDESVIEVIAGMENFDYFIKNRTLVNCPRMDRSIFKVPESEDNNPNRNNYYSYISSLFMK